MLAKPLLGILPPLTLKKTIEIETTKTHCIVSLLRPGQTLVTRCPFHAPQAQGMLQMAMNDLNFSARAYDRILKVARTIADLAGSERLTAEHVGEAVQCRSLDRQIWG